MSAGSKTSQCKYLEGSNDYEEKLHVDYNSAILRRIVENKKWDTYYCDLSIEKGPISATGATVGCVYSQAKR